jgi:hypothetical protein
MYLKFGMRTISVIYLAKYYTLFGSPEIRETNLGQESSIIMMDKVPNCTDVIGEFFGKRQGFPN